MQRFLQLLCGVIFAASAMLKACSFEKFVNTISSIDNLPRPRELAAALIVAETFISGLCFIPRFARLGSLLFAICLTLFSGIAAVVSSQGKAIRCSCFGTLTDEMLGRRTIIRNTAIMGITAPAWVSTQLLRKVLVMVSSLASPRSMALLVLSAAHIGLSLRLLRTHGDLLRTLQQHEGNVPFGRPTDNTTVLEVGDEAPTLKLKTYGGKKIELDYAEGPDPLHIVFIDPYCADCRRVAKELRDFAGPVVDESNFGSPVLVSRGNRSDVLELREGTGNERIYEMVSPETLNLWGLVLLPTAVTITKGGQIGGPFRLGADEILNEFQA